MSDIRILSGGSGVLQTSFADELRAMPIGRELWLDRSVWQDLRDGTCIAQPGHVLAITVDDVTARFLVLRLEKPGRDGPASAWIRRIE